MFLRSKNRDCYPESVMAGVPADVFPELTEADRVALLSVARRSLAAQLEGTAWVPSRPDSGVMVTPAATFVTLRRRDTGELRGCCGETQASMPLIDSVAEMAIASGMRDPRFESVVVDELDSLTFEVTVLSPMQPIEVGEVEVGRHGLMITSGLRRGLLLPQVAVEQGWDRQVFLRAVCQKAGLPEGAWREPEAILEGFEALSFGEADASADS